MTISQVKIGLLIIGPSGGKTVYKVRSPDLNRYGAKIMCYATNQTTGQTFKFHPDTDCIYYYPPL